MKLRLLIRKLRRLTFTRAAREAVALKEQFRSEDRELLAQGRGFEIVARNRRLTDIRDNAKGKRGGFNGDWFE